MLQLCPIRSSIARKKECGPDARCKFVAVCNAILIDLFHLFFFVCQLNEFPITISHLISYSIPIVHSISYSIFNPITFPILSHF